MNSRIRRRLAYLSGAPRVSTRPEAYLSGPRSHVLGVMKAFERLGWDVVPYVVGDRMPLNIVMEKDSKTGFHFGKRAAADLIRIGIGLWHGRKAFREIGKVDWVYERFGAFQAMGWWFQRHGIPWILETNGVLYLESTRDRTTILLPQIARIFELKAYRSSDALVCVSKQLADHIVQDFNIDQSKIVILPNGVDTDIFNPSLYTPKRLFQEPTIGFIGSLHPWHAVELLIEALAELSKEGANLKAVIIGDGPKFSSCEQLVRERGLQAHIHFTGWIPPTEVPAYIAGFDIGYALQGARTHGEKFGSSLKLYEYAAMGKPVIASAHENTNGLIIDRVTGYLQKTDDLAELVQILREAYANREQWQFMGMKARQMVIEKHSWEARVKELLPQLHSILTVKYGSPFPARYRS